ncbi:MAG: pyridoxal phosphate-dependent aminotransferase [Deltaproteobacteria bacterium]|nr:pyridoxal phosphate-dependent aminotransferase [Deltaproteobacteria bacterium]
MGRAAFGCDGAAGPVERAVEIPPFLAMDVMAEAAALERQGRDVVHMEVGEPDLPCDGHVVEAATRALRDGRARYTVTEGILSLREAIAARYAARYGVEVDPERIVVTTGASPAFFLVWGALLDAGDEVLIPDPHYACYPGQIAFLGGVPVHFPLDVRRGYAFDLHALRARIGPRTRAILLNSPSNPTGTVASRDELRALAELAARPGGPWIVSDEIYHGVEYGAEPADTMLRWNPDAFVIDGFSKRWRMTGWRLGWVVLPQAFVRCVRKMHQNYFLCASEFVQHAGLAALAGPQDSVAAMVATYDARRRRLVEGLRRLGFGVDYEPGGAFYVLAGAGHLGEDSVAVSRRLLHEAGVAAAPGADFGPAARTALRFSYATALDRIELGLERLGGVAGRGP